MPNRPDSDQPISDEALLALFAGHRIDRDHAAHYRARLEGRLVINRCRSCGRFHEPPRPMCPSCWECDIEPTEVSGRGTIHLLMRLHQGPPAEGVDYGDGGHPVVVVELAEQEGLRMTGTVVDFPDDDLEIGAEVELDWISRDGAPVIAFRPRSA